MECSCAGTRIDGAMSALHFTFPGFSQQTLWHVDRVIEPIHLRQNADSRPLLNSCLGARPTNTQRRICQTLRCVHLWNRPCYEAVVVSGCASCAATTREDLFWRNCTTASSGTCWSKARVCAACTLKNLSVESTDQMCRWKDLDNVYRKKWGVKAVPQLVKYERVDGEVRVTGQLVENEVNDDAKLATFVSK